MKPRKIKQITKYLNDINPSMLAASITFYLLFIIIPIMVLLSNIFKFLQMDIFKEYQTTSSQNIISGISLAISIIWVSSKFFNALHISSDVIYQDVEKRTSINRRFKSIVLMLVLIVVITIQIVLIIYSIYFLKNILQINQYYIIFIIQFILQFISISFIVSLIYKSIVPIKIKLKNTFFISIIITLCWYILTVGFYIVNNILKLNNYDNLYGSTASIMLLIFWLYLIILVFVYIVALHYYFTKKRNVNK